MPELLDITTLILKHLPPSASIPNVRVCDERSRRWGMSLERQGHITLGDDRPIDGVLASEMSFAPEAASILRPNGRAIFLVPNAADVSPEALAQTLTAAGLVRILAESVLDDAYLLVRGERPTEHFRTTDRIAAIAQAATGAIEVVETEKAAQQYRSLHLLVRQDPPARGWIDAQPNLTWHALTVRDAQADRVVLLAFTSLVKAVAFMQPAVIAGVMQNVNKLPRYETDQFLKWNLPLIVNPTFEALREDHRFDFQSPPLEIDPWGAMRSHE